MSQEISEEAILSIRNLTVRRSGTEVLDSISLDINRGEFVGLVGPNGSGKTTLLLTILGILKPMNGSVKVFGDRPASNKNIGMVGWVPQAATQLPNSIHITVRELIQLGTLNHKNYLWGVMNLEMKRRVKTSLEMTGLSDMADIDVSRLSGGQFQRAVIARALASDTEFILLDEPLVGVDRASRNSLLKLLDDLCHHHGKTILMVSHDLSAVIQTTHRIVFLEGGIQYDGSPENLPDHSQLANLRGIEHTHSGRSESWYEVG